MVKRTMGYGKSSAPARKEVHVPSSDAMLDGEVTDAVEESGVQEEVQPVKEPVKKQPKPAEPGIGGQFVEIGGGIRIPASEA